MSCVRGVLLIFAVYVYLAGYCNLSMRIKCLGHIIWIFFKKSFWKSLIFDKKNYFWLNEHVMHKQEIFLSTLVHTFLIKPLPDPF